jgi:DNA-binding MarR family transcriptional regulator
MSNYFVSKYPAVVTLRAMLDDTMAGWRRERPDLDLEAMGTALRLNQLVSVAFRSVDAVFAPHGISVGEFDVLAALRRNGAGSTLTPSTLARVAMVSPGGMTNRLDRLEAAGLIDRRPDPGDRRGSLVELTARGVSVADGAIEDLVAAENAVFSAISAAERQRLDRTLDKLIERLEAAIG